MCMNSCAYFFQSSDSSEENGDGDSSEEEEEEEVRNFCMFSTTNLAAQKQIGN